MVLHSGRIAEMATGEGKTLVATFPGLPERAHRQGRARRDGERLPGRARQRVDGRGLPLSQPDRRLHPERAEFRAAPPAVPVRHHLRHELGDGLSITCATTAWPRARPSRCSAGTSYAIVDEVDSILIDEARTPLIIAGPATVSSHQYDKFKGPIERLVQAQNLEANRWAADAKKHARRGQDGGGRPPDVQDQELDAAQQAAAEDDRGAGLPRAPWTTRSWRFTRTRARPSSTS